MARYLLSFDEGSTGKAKRLTGKLYAHCEEGRLRVEFDGKVVYDGSVSGKCLYEIHSDRGTIRVHLAKPPYDDRRLLNWLCGAATDALCFSGEGYKKRVENYRKKFGDENWECGESISDGFKVYWTRKPGPHSRRYYVAFFISMEITTAEILKLLPFMKEEGYPLWYIKNLLHKRFGISPEEVR